MKRKRKNYLLWVRFLRPFVLLCLLGASPLLSFFLPAIFRETRADSLSFAQVFVSGKWFTLQHFSSNAIYAWRLDPLIDWTISAWGIEAFFAASILLFSLGTYLFFAELHEHRQPVLCALSAAIAALALVLIFAYDTLVVASLMWFPWVLFVLALILMRDKINIANFIFLLFFVIRLCKASNQLALLLVLIAFTVVYFLSNRESCVRVWISFAVLLIPALYTLLRVPELSLPLYPPYARVLEQRVPFLDGGDAFVGPVPPFEIVPVQIINRAFLRPFLEPFCFILLLIAVISALDVWRRRGAEDEHRIVLCGTALFLAVSCVLDTSFVSAAFSQISPLYALSRMLPGLVYLPLIYLAMALCIFFVSSLLVSSRAWDLLLLLAVILLLPLRWENWDQEAYAQRNNSSIPWKELQVAQISEQEKESRKKVLLSPSYGLVLENSPGFFEKYPRKSRDINLTPLSKIEHSLSASKDTELLQRLVKLKEGIRWSSGGGKQVGTEWIRIRFARPQILHGLKLDLGDFPSDFPRGLEVLYSRECQGEEQSFESYKHAFRRKHWRGEIAYTESGYPFMEPEANVLMVFDAAIEAQCVLIKQIGKSDDFEWSVRGIKIGY